MADDDVESWIVWGLGEASVPGNRKASIDTEDVKTAWHALLLERQDPAYQTDDSLAAAEHYMFARYATTLTKGAAAPFLAPSIMIYQSVKLCLYMVKMGSFGLLDYPNWIKFNTGPTTRPSYLQANWGRKGLWDGSPLVPGYAP